MLALPDPMRRWALRGPRRGRQSQRRPNAKSASSPRRALCGDIRPADSGVCAAVHPSRSPVHPWNPRGRRPSPARRLRHRPAV